LIAAARITPAYISYFASSGSVANDVCYWGEMTFLPHALRLFSIRSVTAHISFAATISNLQDRKQAAEATRMEVLRMSGLSKQNNQQSPSKMGA
jgi:lyso-ornithine lipid O-acyltransferase